MKNFTSQNMLQKVPEITVYFWIVKILTTAMGESTSDYLVSHMNSELAVILGFLAFVIALSLQFSVRKYVPWIYWFAVAMVAVFGTMAADVLHIGLGIPYLVSTIFFGLALIIIFLLWYRTEKTLSIHSINTTRSEIFYWATVLATFALGTALGDMTASTLGWGYLSSGIVFAILIAVIAAGHYIVKGILGAEHKNQSRNVVFAFWFAYIITRPLGASFSDWMGKAPTSSGLGFGDGSVALVLTILIILFVWYFSIKQKSTE